MRVDYGKGAVDGSAQFRLDDDGVTLHAFNVWTYGTIEIPFDFMNYTVRRHSPTTVARRTVMDIAASLRRALALSMRLDTRPSVWRSRQSACCSCCCKQP